MSRWRLLTVSGLLLLSGCLYHAKENTDQAVCDLVAHPFDVQPADSPESPSSMPPARTSASRPPGSAALSAKPAALPPSPSLDVQATALMETEREPQHADSGVVQTGALEQVDKDKDAILEAIRKRLERLKIPKEVPGEDTPPIQLPKEQAAREAMVKKLYPPMPPLPAEPKPLPGPDGHPYTLADLQQLAAANSPTLRQAASDVEAARGNLIQAGAYPNPTFGLQYTPSSDGSTSGAQGVSVDQVVKTFGKLKLQSAAAEMALRNAELALKRARSDLSTAVRNAYFAVLVAKEAVVVTGALAHFTDEVYFAQADALLGGIIAYYEPAALRSQAWTTRLAYKQAISSYLYAWKQFVATLGLRQLPLTEVAGRIDRAIPYYDYDAVLAHALNNHTDVLTARNTVEQARYNLKLAQITPYPDVEFNVAVLHDFVVPPMQTTPTVAVTFPLPLWDKNKGNIIAAEAALARASDEPHRVEVTITNNLAAAYANYKNNLDALEYYRKFILPDQVRTYRGIFERRRIDPALGFVDLVTAQQSLLTNETTYLGILGTLWTSVVGVADFLQTDDLFQLAKPQTLPELPDLEALPPWRCAHPCSHLIGAGAAGPEGGCSLDGSAAPHPTPSAQGTILGKPSAAPPIP